LTFLELEFTEEDIKPISSTKRKLKKSEHLKVAWIFKSW